MMQLRKAVSLNGLKAVQFNDGQSVVVSEALASSVISHYSDFDQEGKIQFQHYIAESFDKLSKFSEFVVETKTPDRKIVSERFMPTIKKGQLFRVDETSTPETMAAGKELASHDVPDTEEQERKIATGHLMGRYRGHRAAMKKKYNC